MEDLVAIIRKGLPTETQSMVKRIDEQAFAIMNGSNPMFVEHATRRLSKVLNADKFSANYTDPLAVQGSNNTEPIGGYPDPTKIACINNNLATPVNWDPGQTPLNSCDTK